MQKRPKLSAVEKHYLRRNRKYTKYIRNKEHIFCVLCTRVARIQGYAYTSNCVCLRFLITLKFTKDFEQQIKNLLKPEGKKY